jgi:hypothetical protein
MHRDRRLNHAQSAGVGVAGVAGGFGIDNWKVTVWRR